MGNQTREALAYIGREYKDVKGRVELQRHVVAQLHMIEANNPFDQLAAEYDEYRSGYSRSLYDILSEYGFKPGWSVLDVACGTGLASEPLAKRGQDAKCGRCNFCGKRDNIVVN